MRVRQEQLASSLQQAIKPVYLIFGDEALLVEEAADVVRQVAKQAGANDRQVWHAEGRFDWTQIKWQEQSLSLFASRRLIEIRIPSGSPGKEGGEALRRFAAQPPADTTLLIISGKIDKRSQKSKWFSELDALGVTLPVWPVNSSQLPKWIAQRMHSRGLNADKQCCTLIAQKVEGNLFAAVQEIDKLRLLATDDQIDVQLIEQSVADNARFEAFGLMDMALSGRAHKLPRIIERLRDEGVDIMTVFAAVSWSLQRMIDMAFQMQQGIVLERMIASQKPPIWDNKKAMTRAALERHRLDDWQQFAHQLGRIDQAAKGVFNACPWRLLERLCLRLAGVTLNMSEEI